MHPQDEREWQTRETRIDGWLEAQGWKVVPFDAARPLAAYRSHAIEEYPTDYGPADYVLVASGRILAVVEAKKISLGPQNVLLQAERYARGVNPSPFNFGGFHVPFLYSTNGEVLWFHDIRHDLNRSRRIHHFHTPQALGEMLGRDFEVACAKLAQLPNNHDRLRPYQADANAAVEKAIADRKRQMLVAMGGRHRQDVHHGQSGRQDGRP